jgi:inositol transport system substrate-binding protein
MKQIKKLMVLVLAVCMVVLTGCGGKSTETTTDTKTKDNSTTQPTTATTETTEATTPAQKDIVVGYIAKNTVDAFHSTLNKAASEKLDELKANGSIKDWKLLDGLTDPVTQCNLLEDALNMGCNLIILLPAESAGCSPILERCKEEGVPIIVVNSKTDNTDDLATAFVGSDDVQAGEMMAEFIQEKLPNGGGYGHLQGIIGNSAQIQRGEGIHNVLDADSKWALLDGAEQTAEWQAEKAVKFAEDWLAKYGDKLNAVICDNDDMSSAVQTAMNAAGRSDIVCIGVDGNVGPMTMVKNGELLATVYQDGASQVIKGIETGVAAAQGQTVEKTYMIPFVLITKDNVDQYLK